MESRPCAVIASCTSTHPEDIIKSILGVEDLPDYTEVEDGIKAYPWHIDTKYYTADVNLCAVEKKTLGSEDFAVSVEAIVVHFDSNRSDGLSAVEGWLSFLKEFEPEVQILLCDRCEEEPPEGLARVTVQEWCVEQGFELVELNPDLDPEWEAEQDFLETTGVKRVIQALHAHLWPNLHMKGKPQQLSRTVQSMLVGNAPTTPTNGNSDEDADQGSTLDNSSFFAATCTEERIDELLGDSGGVAGFSSLFEQLCTMKERVSKLPSDQRRACAEQVVMAFWKAIGGDDDELSGLGSN
ncbi:alpha- and gamma-adaptin-binding protein p34-like [Schistocerca gregaria]|uniref:alpha- and gamma-adaptin-binding protein p34-like n=1 Tax=Schistocerca gregaria TaxID=7010 RepID=UPI00211F04C3|nr:alpha- and gamma-adaptin-binding protein p34-like [Schistocerca gregaria]